MTALSLAQVQERLFVTVRELAEITSTDERTVRRGIAAGEIPALRVSTTTRIPARWLLEQARAIDPDMSEAPGHQPGATATAIDPDLTGVNDAIVTRPLHAVNNTV